MKTFDKNVTYVLAIFAFTSIGLLMIEDRQMFMNTAALFGQEIKELVTYAMSYLQ